ncbi:MAG: hypothetical protein IJL96_08860 [Clostridia bacterium]|nr:hypothetical protein [Clostridia bacterium]
MRRRLLAFLLALFMLGPSFAHAGNFFEQYLLDAALIVQRSSRYSGSLYTYNREKFIVRGCGPSSFTNALCIASSVEEQYLADKLLRENMRILTYNYEPSRAAIDVKFLTRLQEPDAEKYPTLWELKQRYGLWEVKNDSLDSDMVMAFAQEAEQTDKPDFLMGFYTLRYHWKDLTEMLRRLADSGMENVILSLAFLGSGSSGTGAPFRLSDGHYVSLSFHCGAFAEDTSMYLLDSNPRALPDEPLISGRYYERYPLDLGGEKLTDSFDFLRISQSIVRVRLNDLRLSEIRETRALFGEEEAEAEQCALLEKLLLYGTGVMMVMIP